jgi:hypothetical protein
MRPPILITTPMPTPDEVADSFGMSQERRDFLRHLAESIKTPRRKKTLTPKKSTLRRKAA